MKYKTVLQLSLPAAVCAVAFCAAEAWNSKEPSEWSADEIDRVLTNSPWAKQTNTTFDSSGMSRRGGMGRMGGGGMGGGGIGGGGMGGGGLGGGGMGRGGGGMGRGGGGGMPDGDRQGGRSISVLVRWNSAQPVQQALLRRGAGEPAPAEGNASDAAEKNYIVSVTGLEMPPMRRSRPNEDVNGADSDDNGEAHGARDPQRMRDHLMEYTKLLRKGKDPIAPDDIKMTPSVGSSEIQFFFPRTDPISLDDKEVTFVTQMGPMKVERKFHLKEMTYKGKLNL